MRMNRQGVLVGTVLGLMVLGNAAYLTREYWLPLLPLPRPEASAEEEHDHEHGEENKVVLTDQAKANLRLEAAPVKPTTWWRTLSVPATVVERPGDADRTVPAPAAGIVTRVLALPGATVRAGDPLFELKLVSEALQTAQKEYYRASRELELTVRQRARAEEVYRAGGFPESKLLELDFQKDRLAAQVQSGEQELLARGLTPEQVKQIKEGEFFTALTVHAPQPRAPKTAADAPPEFEVQELKVQPGEHVEAGQALCRLARHERLYIEGHAFGEERGLLDRAAREGWPVEAELAEAPGSWPALAQPLRVEYVGTTAGPDGLTYPFYVPLRNDAKTYQRDGKTYRVWRFRPGQKLTLRVPVAKVEGVFVLPSEAVVREGPDAYVFVQNGNAFVRTAVHVRYEEGGEAVIANDGSLVAGEHVVRNAAAALNRVLQSKAGGGHGHDHHDHPH
jgi:multidrug efflux pump subunit AcrA (membrane-fusion protein)